MTDRGKVTQWLEACLTGCEYGCPYEYEGMVARYECKADLMRDALELLKGQEPLVIRKKIADEILDDYIAECPECGMVWSMWHSEKMRFCPGCGKAVKWDE